MGYYGNCSDGVSFPDVDELHALSGTSGNTYCADRHSDGHAGAADYHEVIFIGDVLDSYQASGLLRDVEGPYALCSTGGLAVVHGIRTFAVAIFRYGQHLVLFNVFCLGILANYTNYIIPFIKIDATDAGGCSAKGPGL